MRRGNIFTGAKPTNCLAILSGKDSNISVLATMKGAERKCGTMSAMRRLSPFLANHSSITPMRVPSLYQHMLHRDIFVERQMIATVYWMI